MGSRDSNSGDSCSTGPGVLPVNYSDAIKKKVEEAKQEASIWLAEI
jgi:hypothetical protein